MNEETLNRTPKEIEEMYCTLRESIRNYISRFLEDNHATDANPYDCGISLDFGACGLSDLEKPLIESIFKDDDGSGMIWCNVDWNPEPIDFDSLYTDDQMDIVRNLK